MDEAKWMKIVKMEWAKSVNEASNREGMKKRGKEKEKSGKYLETRM